MRKTFLKVSLLGMLTVGMAAGFTSCKDYDDDVKNLQTQIDAIQKDLKSIQDLVSSGVVITNVAQNADGITINMSNGQSYNITNGKDGAAGKDAVVWDIVKNDKGEYVWAKNGEATELPAQGPAGADGKDGKDGEAGTAVAGSYYVPNAETGVFDEHKADGTVVPTTIPCFAKGSLTAVDDGSNIIISGILDEDGNATEPFVLSKTGALSSLEFIPDLYVNGIEAMETDLLHGIYQEAVKTTKDVTLEALIYDQITGDENETPAVIAGGQIYEFGNLFDEEKQEAAAFHALSKTDANYILNPANANLSDVTYKYITNDAEVRNSRASEAVLNINSTTAADGKLTVNYSIADLEDIWTGEHEWLSGKDLQTVAALQATLKDGSVVSSNFVALDIQRLSIGAIMYRVDDYREYNIAAKDAEEALSATYYHNGQTNQGNHAWALALPYDKVSNLPDYLRIALETGSKYPLEDQVEIQTPGDKDNQGLQDPNSQSGSYKYYTLAEIAEKYGYTMSYSLLEYTLGWEATAGYNSTSENMYASVSADGKFQPMYVNAAGQSVPTTTEAGRSAIGRQPVVILQLKDAEGNIVLGGFVKVVLTEKTAVESINLGEVEAGYTCGKFITITPWDTFAGQVVEATGMTVTEFQLNYKLDELVLGVEVDGKIVEIKRNAQSQENHVLDREHYWNNFGRFDMDEISGNGETQVFGFMLNSEQAENWYPKYAKKDGNKNGYNYKAGDQIGVGDMTKTPVTKTLYAKFYNAGNNSILWVGYTVTLTGVPTITYDGKNPNTWIAGKDIVPVSPAVGNNYEGKPDQNIDAKVISVNPTSLWLTTNGQPNFKVAAPFQTADESKNNYFGNTAIKYAFAEKQPSYTTHEIFGTFNGKVVYKTYGFIGEGNTLYGACINDDETGEIMTGEALETALENTDKVFAVFDENNIFKIVAAEGVVNDVINTNAFSKTAPETLFNIEMNLTYGSCEIPVNNFGSFQVGVGRPINVKPATTPIKFVDATGKNKAPIYNFANIVDWQSNYLWKVDETGAHFTENPHGQKYFDFWMGEEGKLVIGWEGEFADDAALNAEYLTGINADMSDAQKGVRHGFTIRFDKANTDQLNLSSVGIMNEDVLNNTKVVYGKYGDEMSTVTSAFYVFVPVKAVYTWGETNIGYAAIQIDPTHMGE